jgi:uncharacterized protein
MKESIIKIPYQISLADTFFKRLKGLMFRKTPIKNEGLWIVPCNSVHMFFMKFPIDVVLLDEKLRVVGLYHSLRPWKITRPVKKANSTLELPAGSVKKLGIDIGSRINFEV